MALKVSSVATGPGSPCAGTSTARTAVVTAQRSSSVVTSRSTKATCAVPARGTVSAGPSWRPAPGAMRAVSTGARASSGRRRGGPRRPARVRRPTARRRVRPPPAPPPAPAGLTGSGSVQSPPGGRSDAKRTPPTSNSTAAVPSAPGAPEAAANAAARPRPAAASSSRRRPRPAAAHAPPAPRRARSARRARCRPAPSPPSRDRTARERPRTAAPRPASAAGPRRAREGQQDEQAEEDRAWHATSVNPSRPPDNRDATPRLSPHQRRRLSRHLELLVGRDHEHGDRGAVGRDDGLAGARCAPGRRRSRAAPARRASRRARPRRSRRRPR